MIEWGNTNEFDELDRALAIASISSKKMIAGAASRARRNSSRIARSDSPTHLLNNSGPYNNCRMSLENNDISTDFDGNEVQTRFGGDGFGHHRLRATRWSVHQNALGHLHVQSIEGMCVFQWPHNHFLQTLLQIMLPTDIWPFHLRNFEDHFTHTARPNDGQRVLEMFEE